MAGRRHHFIPQFLLRRFAIEDGKRVLVYQKEKEAFATSTINAGIQKDFYGGPQRNEADDVLTRLEPRIAEILDLLNSGGPLPFAGVCAEFVLHFMTRTRHFRATFSDDFQTVLKLCVEKFEDENFSKRVVIAELRNKPAYLTDAGLPPATALQVIRPGVLEPFVDEFFKCEGAAFSAMIEHVKQKFVADLPQMLARHHNDALADNPSSGTDKHAALSKLKWEVVNAVGTPYILGDCVTLFEYCNTRGYSPFDSHGPMYDAVYLPLSSHKLLVGSRNGSHNCGSSDAVNLQIARCSRESFYASARFAKFDSLREKIGENYRPISDEEIIALVEKLDDVARGEVAG